MWMNINERLGRELLQDGCVWSELSQQPYLPPRKYSIPDAYILEYSIAPIFYNFFSCSARLLPSGFSYKRNILRNKKLQRYGNIFLVGKCIYHLWWAKQTSHLVPSQNIFILSCFAKNITFLYFLGGYQEEEEKPPCWILPFWLKTL